MITTPITIALVTYNSERFVRDCIASLPAAFDGHEWRLVVVDNDSTDGTRALAAECAPTATVVNMGRNAGYAAAINVAIEHADGDVFVLNPDTIMRPASGAALARALARAGVGIAVPRVVDPEGNLDGSLRRAPTLLRALGEAIIGGDRAGRIPALGEVVHDPRAYLRGHSVDWALGAVMLVSRACLDAVGPWDESFFLYSEETDFCLRARDHGFTTWYEPTAIVEHVGGDSGVSPRLWTILTLNRVRLYRKRHGERASTAFWAAVTLGEALRIRRPGGTHHEAFCALRRGVKAVDRELAQRCPDGAGPHSTPASNSSNTAT